MPSPTTSAFSQIRHQGAELRALAELAVQLVAEARRRPGAPGDPFVHVRLLQETVLSDVLRGGNKKKVETRESVEFLWLGNLSSEGCWTILHDFAFVATLINFLGVTYNPRGSRGLVQ